MTIYTPLKSFRQISELTRNNLRLLADYKQPTIPLKEDCFIILEYRYHPQCHIFIPENYRLLEEDIPIIMTSTSISLRPVKNKDPLKEAALNALYADRFEELKLRERYFKFLKECLAYLKQDYENQTDPSLFAKEWLFSLDEKTIYKPEELKPKWIF